MHTKKPDIDNLFKAIDAIIEHDESVQEIHATKCYGDHDEVTFILEDVEYDPQVMQYA